jgi:metal-responsive CopG/Arc/MetJ family transcriptional regulator
MEGKNDLTYWNVPVNRMLNKALEEAIKLAGYRTKTEFIRDAVRRRLEELGIKLSARKI